MGYTISDLNAHDDKKGWKWGVYLDQPVPLTDISTPTFISSLPLNNFHLEPFFYAAWKSMLPKLEKTLRLRKGHHQSMKRDQLMRSISDRFFYLWHVREPADQIASINPETLYKFFPDFQAILDNPNYVGPIPDYMWKTLEDTFEGVVNALAKEAEAKCVSTMEAAYRTAGVAIESGAGDIPSTSTEDSDMVPRVLLHGVSLFKHRRTFMSYAGILKLRDDTPPVYRDKEWHKGGVEVPEGVIGIARALLRNLSLPESTTMLFLENLGNAFCCRRCWRRKKNSKCLTWSALVSLS